jgi:hypothetical protein
MPSLSSGSRHDILKHYHYDDDVRGYDCFTITILPAFSLYETTTSRLNLPSPEEVTIDDHRHVRLSPFHSISSTCRPFPPACLQHLLTSTPSSIVISTGAEFNLGLTALALPQPPRSWYGTALILGMKDAALAIPSLLSFFSKLTCHAYQPHTHYTHSLLL